MLAKPDHQGHLDRSRKSLPPDENLPVLDALLWILDPVLRQVLDKGNAGAHIEECPGQVEELGHAPPDAQCLRRRQDIRRQDQVLVNDERDEENQTDAQGDQETAQRAVEADIFPFCRFFMDLELGAVRNDFIQFLRVPQAVAAHDKECREGGYQHQSHDTQQDIPFGSMRYRRSGIICKRERRLPGGAHDQVVDQIVEIRPILDLWVETICQESIEDKGFAARADQSTHSPSS